ncbi:unnamed protein product [Sphagnum compactum]
MWRKMMVAMIGTLPASAKVCKSSSSSSSSACRVPAVAHSLVSVSGCSRDWRVRNCAFFWRGVGHGCNWPDGRQSFRDRKLQRFSNWQMSSSLALGPASSWMLFSPRHLRASSINEPAAFPRASMIFGTIVQPETRSVASLVNPKSERQPQVIDDVKLLKAIVYEAQHGFSNVFGVASRFGDFLYLQLSLKSSMAGGSLSSLVTDAKLYDAMLSVDRAHLLDRVVRLLGFCNTRELIAHYVASREASQDLPQETQSKNSRTPRALESNISLKTRESGGDKECNGFPNSVKQVSHRAVKAVPSAIVFGSSEPIELYNPARDRQANSNAQATLFKGASSDDVDPTDACENQATEVPEKVNRQVKKVPGTVVRSKENSKTLSENVPLDSPAVELQGHPAAVQSKTIAKELILTKGASMYKDCVLDIPVSYIKNFSLYQRSRLEENGLHTLRMLLQLFPRMYVNFQQAGQRIKDGQHTCFVGTIISSKGRRMGQSLGMVEVVVKSHVDSPESSHVNEDSGEGGNAGKGNPIFLHLKKFYRGARFTSSWFLDKMTANYPVNAYVAVGGKVKALSYENHFEIRDFNLEVWERDCDNLESVDYTEHAKPEVEMTGKPYPVYPSKGALQPKTIEFCIQRMLPLLPVDLDPLPKETRDKFQVMDLHQAYLGIHTPSDSQIAEKARQRLVFDEFFYLQLGMLLQRQQLASKYLGAAGMSVVADCGTLGMEMWSPLTLKLVQSLPYSLTKSQIKAVSEIMWDLQRPIPMNRLLQGDVGCGKTIVATLGLLKIIDAGYQGALMAPTEFLAAQHYERIKGWLKVLAEEERPEVALLTGSTPASKARIIRSKLETGEIALAVGTHSLTSESVKFARLGLAVIDEQHRFGVAQRGRLNSKVSKLFFMEGGNSENLAITILPSAPHVLAMSATPIPRTLALAMHGDMSISQITELPPGRPQTVTHAFQGNAKGRGQAYEMMRKELKGGGRVFIVYPVIELSENVPDLRAAETEFENIADVFEEFQCGLVHGRLKSQEKDAAMEAFKSGKTQVLVSTTLIEVGIDIPEASMIVVEHAERYGMAQLHQLRGRVGRGTRPATCILLGSTAHSLERLKLLESSTDGFYLAEIDLKLRGPGEVLGKRQSGFLPEFGLARLDEDGPILEQARSAAEDVLCSHHCLNDLPRLKQELSIRRPPVPLG